MTLDYLRVVLSSWPLAVMFVALLIFIFVNRVLTRSSKGG